MNVNEVTVGLRYRVVKRITDTHVVLECGRMFIINDNLKIEKF